MTALGWGNPPFSGGPHGESQSLAREMGKCDLACRGFGGSSEAHQSREGGGGEGVLGRGDTVQEGSGGMGDVCGM